MALRTDPSCLLTFPRSFGITWVYWGFMGFAPGEMMDGVEMKAVENYLAAWAAVIHFDEFEQTMH